jgi:ubiquinone/menaquinone biosynthesis C-methylase UbiE
MADAHMSVEERLRALLAGLGLTRAHVGSGHALDAVTLARGVPEAIASMTLVCPFRLPSEPFRAMDNRLLFISGDRGPNAGTIQRILPDLPRARSLVLRDYADATWADVAADRRQEVLSAMLGFLDEMTAQEHVAPVTVPQGVGEIAGVSYVVRGSGPALLLLPIGLARSQWDPLIPTLAERYTTIVLGGAHLAFVPTLEDRMRGGYQSVVRNVVGAARPAPGEHILEVGCGSGAVARWLATHTQGANPITAVDVNAYLLREAVALTQAAGLGERINFQAGDAEQLPLPTDAFDVTLSFTVMEEVDADRMLAELVRVTRPGGRVGVVVRATDMSPWFNLELPDELRRAAEAVPGAGADEHGCSDASLYRRFRSAGLRDLVMGPQLGPDSAERSPDRQRLFTARIAQGLPPAQMRQFREAAARAVDEGVMVWAEPYHCAVGVKQ